MLKNFHNYTEKFVSQWFILSLDLIIVGMSFVLSTLFRFNFDLKYIEPDLFKYHLSLVLGVRLVFFLIFRTYSGIVRHTSIEDAIQIFKAVAGSSMLIYGLALTNIEYVKIPYSIILINFFVTLIVLIFSRLLVKKIYELLFADSKVDSHLIIYGAGYLGRVTKNTFAGQKRKYKILGFVDDNPGKIGKRIEGIRVYSKKELYATFFNNGRSVYDNLEIVFAIQTIPREKKEWLLNELLDLGVPLKILPPVKQWMNGELQLNQIHKVNIEDLLQREPILLNNRLVNSYLHDKVILITGAAGSIGSEIVRQLVRFEPKRLILLDQAESALYDLETELKRLSKVCNTEIILQLKNVANPKSLKEVFENYKPKVIFHAAAYKHVPLMEQEPARAIEVNVLGTKIMADLALDYEVEKFVFISTDKAVNPTNVMGATKRLAEMYIQSLNVDQHQTRFITTRFGNVLGSNGSVIPLFKKQIEQGGPVTVTHPDIVRYFMTIPEACQLVLEAGTMGKGGEIYVFEMGEGVKIIDLAKRMIKLSGLDPEKDIEIKFTGLRPGEKLFEEVLGIDENSKPTHNRQIMIASVKVVPKEDVLFFIHEYELRLYDMSNMEIVKLLKKAVPEYLSQNSKFKVLDKLIK